MVREPVKHFLDLKFVLKVSIGKPRGVYEDDIFKILRLGGAGFEDQILHEPWEPLGFCLIVHEVFEEGKDLYCIVPIEFLSLPAMHYKVDLDCFNRYFSFLYIFLNVPIYKRALSG